jgi:transposase-like protein
LRLVVDRFANRIRGRLPRVGDKWHLDEVVLKIAGVKHWLWRAVDQTGIVLDVLVQRRRDKQAAKRLLRKLLKKQMRPPRVMITDKLANYGAAKREVISWVNSRNAAATPCRCLARAATDDASEVRCGEGIAAAANSGPRSLTPCCRAPHLLAGRNDR